MCSLRSPALLADANETIASTNNDSKEEGVITVKFDYRTGIFQKWYIINHDSDRNAAKSVTKPIHTNNLEDQMGRDLLIRQGIKLSHLRLILAVKATGQISAAARDLAISQPAASRLSAELERIVGVKLYDRHPRGIILSEYGERLAARARNLLSELNEAGRELVELSTGMSGSVRIGSVTGPAVELVLPAVKQAREAYPKIDVSVNVSTSDVLAADLLADRLDFFIGRIPADQNPRQFQAVFLVEEPIRLIVREGHPLAEKTSPHIAQPLSLADCVAYDWVLQPEGTLLRHTVENYLTANGVDLPRNFLNTSSLFLTLAAIVQTDAIAPVARSFAGLIGRDALGGKIAALPIANDLAISPYALISRVKRSLSPASDVFYDLLLKEAQLGQQVEGRDIGSTVSPTNNSQ